MEVKRTVVAPLMMGAVAVVSGGWLLQQGVGSRRRRRLCARLLEEVITCGQARYAEPRTEADVYMQAVEGLLTELGDPHTTFMTAEQYADLHRTTTGEYGGLGIQISSR